MFERYYPNVPLDLDDGPFCPQYINGIQGTTLAVQQWNKLRDAMVTILEYIKITINHVISIKCFSDVTVSFITVSTDDVINITTNETAFLELARF